MRALHADLTAAQKLAPLIDYPSLIGTPKIKAVISNKRGAVRLFQWERLFNPLSVKYGDRLDAPDEGAIAMGGTYWIGNQISPMRAKSISSVSCKVHREGSPGTITLVLQALDENGHPDGVDLRTGTYDGDTLTTDEDGEWVTFSFAAYSRAADIQYGWFMKAPSGDLTDNIVWVHCADTPHAYQGTFLITDDSGTSWVKEPGMQSLFIGSGTGPIDQSTVVSHACAMSSTGVLYRVAVWDGDTHLYFSHIASPDEDSIFTDWEDTLTPCGQVTLACKGEYVVCGFVYGGSPYHIYEAAWSGYGDTYDGVTDTGFDGDANTRISITNYSTTVYGMVWTLAHEIHAARRTSGAWGSEIDSGKSLTSISGITVYRMGDYNIVVTGVDASAQDGVWQIVWGDGYTKAVDSWGDFVEILAREASEDFQYFSPYLDVPDVFRLFFVEYHAGTEQGYRLYWSHGLPSSDFAANCWLEPVPYNYDKAYGLAACHGGTNFWLSAPDGVWCASISSVTSTITNDVLECNMKIKPGTNRSSLTIVLDNTSGKYNDFNYKGWQIAVELGYTTVSGDKYSPCPYFWITGWEFVSPPWFPLRAFYPQGIVGTLKIYCEGAWELLERWRARKKYSWAADTKNSFQLLRWLTARAGLEFTCYSSSDALVNYYPEFEIAAGYTGKWAFKKLLSWVEDVPVLVDSYIILKHPESADTAVYYYNSTWQNQRSDYPNPPLTDHLVYRGQYGVGMWKPNMAQVDTDTLHLEQFAWDEINSHYDRLGRVTQPQYTSAADASRRATRELRRGEIWAGYTGFLNCPMNCGQEEFDVIDVVDVAAGVTNIRRRVLGIETIYKKLNWSYQQVLYLGAV